MEKKFNEVNNMSIENTYKSELKKQIEKDLAKDEIYIEDILLDINLETGEITKIDLYLTKNEKNKTNTIIIDKIEIGKEELETKENNLSDKEVQSIKKLLNENYGIELENITVNSM